MLNIQELDSYSFCSGVREVKRAFCSVALGFCSFASRFSRFNLRGFRSFRGFLGSKIVEVLCLNIYHIFPIFPICKIGASLCQIVPSGSTINHYQFISKYSRIVFFSVSNSRERTGRHTKSFLCITLYTLYDKMMHLCLPEL